MKADTDFHRYITNLTGNKILISVQDVIYEQIIRSSVLSMRVSGNQADIFAADHDTILEGLRRKDLEMLRTAIHQHCDRWISRLMRLPEVLGFDPDNDYAVIEESFSERSTLLYRDK